MRKILMVFIFVYFTFTSVSLVNAGEFKNVSVKVNGNVIATQGLIKDSRTLVPLRGVFEELGYTVNWEANTKTATLRSSENLITVASGNSYFECTDYTNYRTRRITPDVPQQIINDRFFIPLRAISESIGADVGWDGNNYIASVNTKISNNNVNSDINSTGNFSNSSYDNGASKLNNTNNYQSDAFDYSQFKSAVIRNLLKKNNVSNSSDLYKLYVIELGDSDLISDVFDDLKLLPHLKIVIIKDNNVMNFSNVKEFFENNKNSEINFCFKEDSFCGGSLSSLYMGEEKVVNEMIVVNASNFTQYYDYYNRNIDYTALKKKIISKIINSSDSDFDKILAIHDYMVLNTEYDYENFKNNAIPQESHNPYYVLKNGVGVCEGYAKATKGLLDTVGIKSYYVVGTGDGIGGWGAHGWLIVELNGSYYHLDVTWDDPVGMSSNYKRYDYFLISDSTISKDHKWSKDDYPKCNSDYGYNSTKGTSEDESLKVYSNDISNNEDEKISLNKNDSNVNEYKRESTKKRTAKIYNATTESSSSSCGKFVLVVEANEYTEKVNVINYTTGERFPIKSYTEEDKHIFKQEIFLPKTGEYEFEIDCENESGELGKGITTYIYVEVEKDESNNSSSTDVRIIEEKVLDSLNKTRIFENDEDPLILDTELSDLASEICSKIKKNDYSGYEFEKDGKLISATYREKDKYGHIAVENVIKNLYDEDSIAECLLMSGINNDRIINSDFTKIGINVAYSPSDSSICCVVLCFD